MGAAVPVHALSGGGTSPLALTWSGGEIVVASADGADLPDLVVEVRFRFLHGSTDLTRVAGPYEVGPTSPAVVVPPWPDLSEKGDLLLAPATITGTVHVLDAAGATVDVVALPERLVFLDGPPPGVTYALEERDTLTLAVLGDALDLVSGWVSPGVVRDLTPEGLVELLDLADRVAAAEVAP